jgi:P-type conjugative transfer protein TrbJ
MRKALIAGVAVVALSVAGPNVRPVHAQLAVTCPTCSSAVEQLVADAKSAQGVATQIQSYSTQLAQYKNELQNSLQIPMQLYSEVTGTLQQIQSLTNAASLLSGGSGSIISRLQSASGYVDQAGNALTNAENIGAQMQQWQSVLGNSARSLGQTINSAQTALKTNAASMTQAQADSQRAAGMVQAIQAGTEAAAANGQILQLMAQSNIALAQQISTAQEVTADRRAQEDAAMLQFTGGGDIATTGSRSWQP